MNIIAIDTETTGLNPNEDELLQFSAVDTRGRALADLLIKPLFCERWEAAEKINGIAPEAVKDCPTIADLKDKIERILNSADLIIGYNTRFDLDFLESGGIEPPDAETLDIKSIFESVKNDVAEDGISRKRQPLVSCAAYYGYDWNGKPHDSLADARATMFCFQKMFGIL